MPGPPQLGDFQDGAAARFPSVDDRGRDIEHVGARGNGWLDIHSSSTAQIMPYAPGMDSDTAEITDAYAIRSNPPGQTRV